MTKPVISRYFSRPGMLEAVTADFGALIQRAVDFPDEYAIQLRDNYFNVYHKGMSLAKITPRRDRYAVSISNKFLVAGLREQMIESCAGASGDGGANTEFVVHPGDIRRFLRVDHLNGLKANITKVGYSEELEFEQVLMTDNPPRNKFIIIDRQIHDRLWQRGLDLLALVRDSPADPFRFLVIEVKTGKNPELRGEVGKQLKAYVEHLEEFMSDYVDCYRENYRQKGIMGLLDRNLPAEIAIESKVQGMVVTGGYSHIATAATDELKRQYPEIIVQNMTNVIDLNHDSRR